MIVEFFKRGRGKSSGPIGYFLGKNLDTQAKRASKCSAEKGCAIFEI